MDSIEAMYEINNNSQYFLLTPQQDKEVRKSARQQRYKGTGQLIYDGDELIGMKFGPKDVRWCGELLSWSQFGMSHDEYKSDVMNALYNEYGGKRDTPKEQRRETRSEINHEWKMQEDFWLNAYGGEALEEFQRQGWINFGDAMQSVFADLCPMSFRDKIPKYGFYVDPMDRINNEFERVDINGGLISYGASTAVYDSDELPWGTTSFDFHKFYNQFVATRPDFP